MSTGQDARRYLRHHAHGVLATLSQKLAGHPFASIVTCVTDHAARPLMLISRLAEHTKNIEADPRVSLLVRDAAEDPQQNARLTLVGHAQKTNVTPSLQARYLRYFPGAAQLLALGDFSFFHIEPTTLRYIGGFGAIHWVAAKSYAPPANTLEESEADIVDHMNGEHAAALREYCRHFKHAAPATVAMAGVDCDGFDLIADGHLMRFDFTETVVDAHSARAAFKALLAAARA